MKEIIENILHELKILFLYGFLLFILFLFAYSYGKLSEDNKYKILMILILFK